MENKPRTVMMAVMLVICSSLAAALNPILEIDMGLGRDSGLLFDHTKVTFGAESMVIHREGDYSVIVTDVKGSPLFAGVYDLNFLAYSDPPSEVDYVLLNEKISYTPKMYKMEVYFKDKLAYARYLDFCNSDGVCDPNENYISCKEDCSLGLRDSICINEEEGVCDPDCIEGADPDCEEGGRPMLWVSIIAIILAIAAIGYFERGNLKRIALEAIENFKY